MMMKVVLAVVMSQFVRSKVDPNTPTSQCLWWTENTVIEIHQSITGNPETPGDTEFTAFLAAMETWNKKLTSCASLTLKEVARTQSRTVGYLDAGPNENIALFRQRRCTATECEKDGCGNTYDCWEHQQQAIAITTTSYIPTTGRVLDSDIEYNKPSFIFTTVDKPLCPSGQFDTDCVATDIQNTTTHELGHLLGLAHTSSVKSTMSDTADASELRKRVLDADTARFVCEVYPKGGASKTCFLLTASPTLGKSAPGCQSVPGVLWLGLGALLRARRKK